MGGRLTTHVLDLAQGRPAANVRVELRRLDLDKGTHTVLASARTDVDGRTEAPLLDGDDFTIGTYELVFDVGEYFAGQRIEGASPPFLGQVPVRFGVADAGAHYHVPLLVSPWAYSTYRGS
jgi:5-hydroxyisourate hydrolase